MTEEPKAADPAGSSEKANKAGSEPFAEPASGPELRPGADQVGAATATAAAAPPPVDERLSSEGIVHRRSSWYSSMAALRYISSLSKDDDVKVRDSDRFTSVALLVTTFLTILSLVIPALAPHRLLFVLICDGLVGLMLLFYVTNRFGIINTLQPRQALLTWQLMMGAGFLGIFATINLAVCIALIVAHTTIDGH